MSKVYEVKLLAADFLLGYVSSQNFKSLQLDPTSRFQAKKLIGILKGIPEYAEKHGYSYFGADFEAPLGDMPKEGETPATRPMYKLAVNSDDAPILTCRVKLPDMLISGLLWDNVFKRMLEDKIPQALADMLEDWLVDFGLKDTFDEWAESVLPADEEEQPKEGAE